MKRVICTFFCFLILVLVPIQVAAENNMDVNYNSDGKIESDNSSVSTSAKAFLLYCPDNNMVVASENADEKLPMASTTKIMSALLALEYASSDNKTVEFTHDMIAEGSSMYLKEGEKVTLYDLAVGMMMQSGNDAAKAAAIAVSGSEEKFVDLMNERAKEYGMSNTSFATVNGLDDENHYSTAYDMSVLLANALKNDDFARITSQKSMTVDFIEPDDKSVKYPNHNRLLSLYDACISGKTGYTKKAGRCLVTAARRDGVTLICTTLNDGNDWKDHISLYDYGFDFLTSVDTSKEEYCVDTVGASDSILRLCPSDNEPLVVPRDQADMLKTEVYLPKFVYPSINKGDVIGCIEYSVDGKIIKKVDLIAKNQVLPAKKQKSIFEKIKEFLHWNTN